MNLAVKPVKLSQEFYLHQKLYQLIFIIFAILSIIYLFFLSSGTDSHWIDLLPQWRVCAYTLRGVDIYTLRGSDDFIPEIGYLYAGFHATPWGCLLENIFYGGFLSFEAAKIYFLIASFVVVLIASFVLRAKSLAMHLGEWAFILSLFSLEFFLSVSKGNAGGMICAFLLIAWLICDEHPYVAGSLIAFSMVKPQVALIVCIMLLMMKRIKPLIVGAVIDISAWLAVSVLTQKGMLELLQEFLFMPSDKVGELFSVGIFTLMFDNFMNALFASMIAGVIFVAILYALMPENVPGMFKIYPAFMAVTFWCYSFNHDNYVLVLPSCLCLWLMLRSSKSVFWLLCGVWCYFGVYIRSIIRRLLMFANHELNTTIAHRYAYTIYEIGIILVGILICFELRQIFSEERA